MKKFLFLTFLILFIDQSIKIFIKTHFEIGESVKIFPWFFIFFIENPGMAYGINLGNGYTGKIILNCLRILLSIIIFFWSYPFFKKGVSNYFIIPISMIFSGAIGNLIDNIFYGVIFDKGIIFNTEYNQWINYTGVAKLKTKGYSFFMGGSVVDMFYFPIVDKYFPNWIPYFGGKKFEFLKFVFNFADLVISIGGILIILFNKKILKTINYIKN